MREKTCGNCASCYWHLSGAYGCARHNCVVLSFKDACSDWLAGTRITCILDVLGLMKNE